jgi:mono/diheme cytochrome c family protein
MITRVSLGLGVIAAIGLCGSPIRADATQAAAAKSVWDGVYTVEQAKRGAGLYALHCSSCHGPGLMGGEAAPPLTGIEFASNWSGLTLGDLFERLRTSMPQDDPAKLSAQQKADILAHMLSVGMFPAGTADLSRETPVLMQIKFEAIKP